MREKDVLKLYGTICMIGFLGLVISFQWPWIGYLFKAGNLIQVQADVIANALLLEGGLHNNFAAS